MIAWVYLAVLACVATGWLYINVAPAFGRNLRYRLPPWDEAAPAEGGSAEGDAAQGDLPGNLPGAFPGAGVVIVCPGRNEAEHLPETLADLCAQDLPGYGVVFIDDASDDDTPAVTSRLAATHAHLLAVRNEADPPPGWVGKCWAIHRGTEALAEAERRVGGFPPGVGRAAWLCFTDADIHWDPRCLRSALAHAQREGADLVALFPALRFGSVGEAVVQLQLVLGLGLLVPFERAMDPAHPDTLTGGAFILVRRSVYESIGGHAAVRGEVVEDLALGRRLKAAGARVRVAMAGELLSCRMYDGWRDMWDGLTKHVFAGMEYSLLRTAGMLTLGVVGAVLPPVYLAASALWWAASPGWQAAAATGLSAAIVALTVRPMNGVRKLVGLPWPYAGSMPLGAACYAVIAVRSVWQYYRGGTQWKGRSYGPGTRAAAEQPA